MIAKKKNKKADLEGKRFAFFQIGLVIAGALTLAAFEYSGIKFDQLAKNEIEKDIYTNLIVEQQKELIVPQKQTVKLKIILPDNLIKQVDKLTDKKVGKIDNSIINEINVDNDGEEDGDINGTIVMTVDNKIYDFPSIMPLFPGGVAAMNNWISEHISLPHYAEPINGTIYVRFIVDENGNIANVSLSKTLHHDYDKAALAVVSKMPRWTPGEQAGKKVKVRYDLPIKFINH